MFNKKITLACIASLTCISTFSANNIDNQLAALEKSIHGKIGVYAIDTNTNQIISHRGVLGISVFLLKMAYYYLTYLAILKKSQSKLASYTLGGYQSYYLSLYLER